MCNHCQMTFDEMDTDYRTYTLYEYIMPPFKSLDDETLADVFRAVIAKLTGEEHRFRSKLSEFAFRCLEEGPWDDE